MTLVRVCGSWAFGFDFIYNRGIGAAHATRSREFLETAKAALRCGHISPFLDTLFSAAELAARALLLSRPDSDFARKGSHRSIQLKFNQQAALGNIPDDHASVLNQLAGLRDRARYLRDEVSLSDEAADEMLRTVEAIIATAERQMRLAR